MGQASEDHWTAQAACADAPTAWFFPPEAPKAGGDPGLIHWRKELRPQAIALCAECPVRWECHAFAKRNGEVVGIWGGVDFGSRWRPPRRRAPAPRDFVAEAARRRSLKEARNNNDNGRAT